MVTFSPRITFGSPLILDQGCSGPSVGLMMLRGLKAQKEKPRVCIWDLEGQDKTKAPRRC